MLLNMIMGLVLSEGGCIFAGVLNLKLDCIMDKEILEETKLRKIQEVEELYEKYKVEIRKSADRMPFYFSSSHFNEEKEAKTIKLSNTTSSMVCF